MNALEVLKAADALIDAEHILELRPDDFMGSTLKVASLIDLERFDEAEETHLELKRRTEESGDEDIAARACTVLVVSMRARKTSRRPRRPSRNV